MDVWDKRLAVVTVILAALVLSLHAPSPKK